MYDELLDTVKSLVSASVFITILTFLVPGIPCIANAYEFAAYRMQQYDFHSVQRGSRSTSVSGEILVYNGQLGNAARKCILARFQHVTTELVRTAASQYAACLLVVVPNRSPLDLNRQDLRHFVDVEHELLDSDAITLPVYVVHESPEILSLFDDTTNEPADGREGAPSIMTVLWNSVVRTSALASVSASAPRALLDYAVPVVTAQYRAVPGASRTSLVDDDDSDSRRKAIVIVAHYDAFGFSPALSNGADANGSGLVALMELARLLRPLFERLGADTAAAGNAARPGFKTARPTPSNRLDRFELVFVAAGGGKLNYYGSKRFVEDELLATKSDAANAAGASPKPTRRAGANVVDLSNLNVQFVLCLDTLAGSFAELLAEEDGTASNKARGGNGTVASAFDRLYVHVAKMPKRDSPIYRFVRLLETVACELRGSAHCRASASDEVRARSNEETEDEFDEQTERSEDVPNSGTGASDQPEFATPFVRVVHKKILITEDRLGWEHERFALKRVAAVTLSALPNGIETRRLARRGSIFDTAAALDTNRLQRNVHVVAEAIARYVHNTSLADLEAQAQAVESGKSNVNADGAMLIDGAGMRNGYTNTLVRQLLTQPRSQQLVAAPSAAGAPKAGVNVAGASASVVQSIEHLFVRYANAAVRTVTFAMEKHDPEFVLYDGVAPVRITVHRAKSTVFDFALLLLVSSYLATIYLLVSRFDTVAQFASASSRLLLTTSAHGTFANGKHRAKVH